MVKIEKIFLRKISKADFSNMYGLNKPTSGGGQTYIDAAGVEPDELEDFLEWGTFSETDFENDDRRICEIEAITLGEEHIDHIEFAPRNKRKNYKISRQTLRDRPHAWHPDNGFPAPLEHDVRVDDETIQRLYEELASHLYVYIVKTDDHRYHAGYINSEDVPPNWPNYSIIREAFNRNASIIDLSDHDCIFYNNPESPFLEYDNDEGEVIVVPDGAEPEIVDEIDYDNIDAVENDPPTVQFPPIAERNYTPVRRNRVAEQKRNVKIGEMGEKAVFLYEKKKLIEAGRPDLAEQVEWSSKTLGDGLGYDIKSFFIDGSEHHIEVKTTTGDITTPFDVSVNEVARSKEDGNSYSIYRIYDFKTDCSEFNYYHIDGDISENCELRATSYKAIPKV